MRPGTSLGAYFLVPVSLVWTLEGNICEAHFCYIYYVKEKYRKFLWHQSDHLLFQYELDCDLSNLIWISQGHCPRHICVPSVRETFLSFCSRSIEIKTYRVYILYGKLSSKGTGSTLRSCNLFTNRRTVSRITVHIRLD